MFADRIGAAGTYAASPKFVAIGTGSHTAATTDTALTTEVETRTSGTVSLATTTVTGDTYQVVGLVTATAGRVVIEAGLFDASSTGNMFFTATFSAINLSTNDTITLTFKTKVS